MKALYSLRILVFIATSSFGQAPPAKVDFCGQQYEVPAGATLVSSYEVRADKFDIILMYLNPADLRNGAPADYTKQRVKKIKGKELQEVACFIQGTPAKAFKYGYETEKGMAYELLAYGVTKGQPVMIQLTLDVDPYNNVEIPEFARQFLHFDK